MSFKITSTSIATFLLLTISSTTNIVCMEKKHKKQKTVEKQICFYLNSDRKIRQSAAFGDMSFNKREKEFMEKDIVTVLPLSPEKQTSLLNKFNYAKEKNKIVYAAYSIEQENFKAKIWPIKNEKHTGYFVQIRHAKK